jgi:Ca2+-transporting ATPase
VEASRAKYGPNTTPSPPKPGIFAKIWAQLNNMLVFILLGAAVIAGIFQDWGDLALILGAWVSR